MILSVAMETVKSFECLIDLTKYKIPKTIKIFRKRRRRRRTENQHRWHARVPSLVFLRLSATLLLTCSYKSDKNFLQSVKNYFPAKTSYFSPQSRKSPLKMTRKEYQVTHENVGVPNIAYIVHDEERQVKPPTGDPQVKEPSFAANRELQAGKRKERIRLWRSIICSWFAINMAFSVLLTLMNSITSLLHESNVGYLSLILASAAQIMATFICLAFLNRMFGMKKVFMLATLLILFYTGAFFYPEIGLFIPASLGMGVAFAIFFCNSFAYGNALGYWYHKLNGGKLDSILSCFSGLMNASVGGGLLGGNLIYYQILKPREELNDDSETDNILDADDSNETQVNICGASYCNEYLGNSSVVEPPPVWSYNTLIFVFLGISVASFVLLIFIVEISHTLDASKEKKSKSLLTIIKESYHLFTNSRSFLLILITLFVGMEEQFIIAVYTTAYVTCSFGIAKIGYVMFNFGAAQILITIPAALLVKLIGRPATVAASFVLFLSVFGVLLLVPTNELSLTVSCVLVFLYGAADSLLVTSAFSVYGLLFPDDIEGSFSQATLWYSIGNLIINTINPLLCVYIKFYIMIATGTLGVFTYFILEYLIYKKYFK